MTTFKLGHTNNFGRKIARVNHLTQAILLRELVEGWCTITDLCDETGLSEKTVRSYLKELVKQKLVYFSNNPQPNARGEVRRSFQFRWGPGKQNQHKTPRTSTERSRESRARKRQLKTLTQAVNTLASVETE